MTCFQADRRSGDTNSGVPTPRSPRRVARALRSCAVFLVGSAAVIVFAQPASSDTYTPPTTIAADCSTDVTAALTSWMTTVPDNSVVSFPAKACYRIDSTVELDGRNALDFEGNGASFKAGTAGNGTRAHWRFVGGSQITMNNMSIVGSDSAGGTSTAFDSSLQWQHGVDLRGVSGATVSNLTISNVYGDCVYVGLGYDGATWSSSVSVHDNTCQLNGRQGMSVTAGRNVAFTHNAFHQVGLMGVDIEPNGGVTGAQSVQITNNSFDTGRQQFVNVLGNSGGGAVSDISISGNTVSGKPLDTSFVPASGQRWSNIVFSNNTSDTPSSSYPAVVNVADIDGLTVTNNVQPGGGPTELFVAVTATCNITVSGNQFPGGGAQLGYTGAAYTCTSSVPPVTETFIGTLGLASSCPGGTGGAYACSWSFSTSAAGTVTAQLTPADRRINYCISIGGLSQCKKGSFSVTTPSLSSGTYSVAVRESGRMMSTGVKLAVTHT